MGEQEQDASAAATTVAIAAPTAATAFASEQQWSQRCNEGTGEDVGAEPIGWH